MRIPGFESGTVVRGQTPEEVQEYLDANSNHDQTECGGTWRSHSNPQDRLDCIKTSDQRR